MIAEVQNVERQIAEQQQAAWREYRQLAERVAEGLPINTARLAELRQQLKIEPAHLSRAVDKMQDLARLKRQMLSDRQMAEMIDAAKADEAERLGAAVELFHEVFRRLPTLEVAAHALAQMIPAANWLGPALKMQLGNRAQEICGSAGNQEFFKKAQTQLVIDARALEHELDQMFPTAGPQ